MANSVSQVAAGKPLATGGILTAPKGTALPTTQAATPNVAFVSPGYIGEDGFSYNPERTTEKKRAWGGDIVKIVQTDFSVEVKFTLIEAFNVVALNLAFGDANVDTSAANGSHGVLNTVRVNATQLEHLSLIAEIKDGLAKQRIVAPDFQVTNIDEIQYTDADLIGYAVTGEAFPDATGNALYIYTDDGIVTA